MHSIRAIDSSSFRFKADVVRAILAQAGDAVTKVDLEPVSAPTSGVAISEGAGFFEYLGLRSGDVLVSADNSPVRGLDDLVDAFSDAEVGEKFTLRLMRNGNTTSLSYVVE